MGGGEKMFSAMVKNKGDRADQSQSQQAPIRSCYLSKDEKDLPATGYLRKCAFPEEGWVLMHREQLCAHGTAKMPCGWSQEGKHQGRRH